MEKSFIGHFDLYLSENADKPQQHIEIAEGGKFIQTGLETHGHLANWKLVDGMLVVTYINSFHGFIVFSAPDNEDFIYGTHMYASGIKSEWILKRVKK